MEQEDAAAVVEVEKEDAAVVVVVQEVEVVQPEAPVAVRAADRTPTVTD